MIPLLEPYFGGREREYVEECFRTNTVSSIGPFVERFEQAFAEYVGSKYAVAVSSGTAALHLAMRVLDVGPGDEVLAPTFSFVASVNPILYQGATPVLLDAEPDSWGLDPALVKWWRRSAKAVVVAHLYGHPAKIEAIRDICAESGIPLIEDAAEALGATVGGRHVGTFGHIGCYSFNGNKVITTGGGGMIVTDDGTIAEKARHLSRQARVPGPEFEHDVVGYNYRLTNLAAAVGLAQLEQLPEFIARKRAIEATYDAALGVRPRPGGSGWLYSVLAIDPEGLGIYLSEQGIQTRRVWVPMHLMNPYRGFRRLGGTVAETLHATGLSLPSSVGLTGADQETVIAAVRRGLTVAA